MTSASTVKIVATIGATICARCPPDSWDIVEPAVGLAECRDDVVLAGVLVSTSDMSGVGVGLPLLAELDELVDVTTMSGNT